MVIQACISRVPEFASEQFERGGHSSLPKSLDGILHTTAEWELNHVFIFCICSEAGNKCAQESVQAVLGRSLLIAAKAEVDIGTKVESSFVGQT
jgi:hypothetical protein